MKKSLASAVILSSILATQAFAKSAPRSYTVDVDNNLSKALIQDFEAADLTPEVSDMMFTIWSFDTVTCEEGFFENMAVGGGPGLHLNRCELKNADGQTLTLSSERSVEFIKFLDRFGIAYQSAPGVDFRLWNLEDLKCQKTEVEIVAPGGKGFQIFNTTECSVVIN